MSLLDRFTLLAAAVGAALNLASVARADDAPVALITFTNATSRPIESVMKLGEIVGTRQARRVFIKAGTNEFVFTLPEGMRMESTAQDKVVLSGNNSTFFLTFRIVGVTSIGAGESAVPLYREFVFSQYPGAKATEEGPAQAAGRHGHAFDMRWSSGGSSERWVRVALVPSSPGLLEFSVVSDKDKANEARFAYNYILGSFQSNERGKIEIVPLMDRS